ncbi:MAG: hypothetical protein SGPRY_006597, partial [Prymnesium sp.]
MQALRSAVENKVSGELFAQDLLERAGTALGLDVYVFGDDLTEYFNQIRMQVSDLWKLNLWFGTRGASSIAQRFSYYGLLELFYAQMNEADFEADDEALELWKAMREGGVTVFPQQRLYAAFMYTDDPIFVVVGAARTVRAIR